MGTVGEGFFYDTVAISACVASPSSSVEMSSNPRPLVHQASQRDQ